MKRWILIFIILISNISEGATGMDAKKANELLGKFKKVRVDYNYAVLGEDIVKALPYLKKAMVGIDLLYMKQQDEKLLEYWDAVKKGKNKVLKEFIETFKGPWDHFNKFKSITSDFNNRREGCAFYPADMTKDEFTKFIDKLSRNEKEKFTDTYTVIRRNSDKLEAIPFHVYYKDLLANISANIKQAAHYIKHPGLKKYLNDKALHLLDGDNRESDSDWVKLRETPLEFVIGPYEVYDDNLMGLKASYEAMLLVTDAKKAELLKGIETNLKNIAKIFPLPAGSKSSVGKISPIIVADQIYAAGDANSGVQSIAFNLPNDPWVRGNVGWKQVMKYNIMKIKFDNISVKIAERVLHNPKGIKFEPFFYSVLFHEVSHGLGPAYRSNGEEVNKVMGKNHSYIEEAKADIGGVYILQKLRGQYGIPSFTDDEILKSFLAGFFRSIRFGVHEAHGKANIIEFNWFKEYGVLSVKNSKYVYHTDKFLHATESLLNKLSELQASASQKEVEEFLKSYGLPGTDLIDVLKNLSDIFTDIRVRYSL